MKLLLIIAATATVASPSMPADKSDVAPATFKPVPKSCGTLALAYTPDRRQFRKLAELHPAEAYQALYRLDEKGCPDPMLVSERIYGRRR